MLAYQYQPLEFDDWIRILILHPSSNKSDSIVCTIQHIQLSDASLNYEALSYTWGDITQRKAIYFHGGTRELLVGQTCLDALRNLRQESTHRLLWIDAICINQEDLSERSRQVRIMDAIYNHASNVVVFLGQHDVDSRALFKELAAADELIRAGKECDRPFPSDMIVHALKKLYARPWFKRVWVLQEVCAKRSVIFMCGSDSASFSALKTLFFGYSRHTKVIKGRWPLVLEWMFETPEEFPTPHHNLWRRLYESRECLATDPRDRIFAMKSLTGPRQSELDHLINYDQSLEECLMQVAEFFLPVRGLRMLTAIRHPHDRNMPSWIPDWSQDLPLHTFYLQARTVHSSSDSEYKNNFTSVNEPMHEIRTLSGIEDNKKLELLTIGYQYAHIVERSHEFSFDSIDEAEIQMRRLYYSLINLRNIFAVGDVPDNCMMLEHLGQSIVKNGFYMDAHAPIEGEQVLNYMQALQKCRISLLGNGELAITPATAEINDVICILANTDSPCALRPCRSGAWTLVSGDCYIFGEVSTLSLAHGGDVLNEYIGRNLDKIQEFSIR